MFVVLLASKSIVKFRLSSLVLTKFKKLFNCASEPHHVKKNITYASFQVCDERVQDFIKDPIFFPK